MVNIICEVYGVVGTGNCSAINEIQFYNKSGQLITLSTVAGDVYNSMNNLNYWNQINFWSRDNLKDGSIGYTSNATGTTNSVAFMTQNNNWTRFLIQLNIDNISQLDKIRTYIGDPENRTPVSVKYFYAKNYDKTKHLDNRDNTGLALLATLNFSQVVTVSAAFDRIANFKKFLIKENNQYYSLKTEFYDEIEDVYRPQVILQEPVKNDFEDYGIDNLPDIKITAFNKLIQEKFNILTLK